VLWLQHRGDNMVKTKAILYNLLLAALLIFTLSGSLYGQCHGWLNLSPDFYGYDFLIRLCVHFGEVEDIPEYIQCSRSLFEGEEEVSFPIYMYNAHEGIRYIEFGVESNDTITAFEPQSGFMIYSAYGYKIGDVYRFDVALKTFSPVCAPVLIGYVKVKRVHGADPVWLDLTQNEQTHRMIANDIDWYAHYVFPPQHGGYIGSGYLYTCQEPVCPEPNLPVKDFSAKMSVGCAVELRWTAGSGNTTVIRYRTDRYPTGYDDGELVVEVPSIPGESQYYFHTGIPSGAILYYKAFSLTKGAGGEVITNSFVECSSVDTVLTNCEISVERSTWGEIKGMYR